MNNLVDSGLDLRTIEVRQLHQIVADLNFNFKQMLHLPGFKGQTGKGGDSITGAKGQRGNMWIFAEASRFISIYSTVTSSGQVTISLLNGQASSSLVSLLTALQITELVNNDIVVLPSRDVIQFDSTTNTFTDTGIRFADGLSLTESEVISIVNNILGGLTNNDVYTSYRGVVKNYADNSAGLNTEENYNSVIDIPVSGSGMGLNSNTFQFTSLKEAVITSTIQNMLITGSPALYHKLVQSTMANKTVDFMSGVDDFGALAVMQNSYKNGILLGHKDANDFSTWGRIFRTEQNLRLLSDYHPTLSESGRLDLGKLGTELYSPKNLKMVIKDGFVSIEDYMTAKSWLYGTEDYMTLGHSTLPYVKIENSDYTQIYSKIGSDTELLGLYGNKLKASAHQPKSDEIINDAKKLVTHNLFYEFQTELDKKIEDVLGRLALLESQKVYRQQIIHNGDINANLIIEFGVHIINVDYDLYTYTNFPNNFTTNGFAETAFIKVNRHDDGTKVLIEQEYVHKNLNKNSTLSSKRIGESINGGGSYVWSEWSFILDSQNFRFLEGDKTSISTVTFDDGFEITFGHAAHSVSNITVGSDNEHNVLTGIVLDSTGHPISSKSQNLDDWFYTKDEVSDLITSHLPIGSIIIWSGSSSAIPDGYVLCDGTNNSPNLKGKFLVGIDSGDSSFNVVNETGGGKTTTLTTSNLPRHSHTGNTGFGGSHSHTYVGDDKLDLFAEKVSSVNFDSNNTSSGLGGVYRTSESGFHRHSFTTDTAGLSSSFSRLPPYYTVCYIMFVGF